MEAIYDIVLNHDSLQNSATREAHAYNSYGFYLINEHGDFRQGLHYLYRAVDAQPDHAQNWINLIKVLVVMQRADEAEQQLERFRAAGIPGAGDRDFKHLADLIDEARNVPAEQATSQTVAEKLE